MADISDVNVREISDLYQQLESLSCMTFSSALHWLKLTFYSPDYDTSALLTRTFEPLCGSDESLRRVSPTRLVSHTLTLPTIAFDGVREYVYKCIKDFNVQSILYHWLSF